MANDTGICPGRLIEIDGEAAALLIPTGDRWEVHALDARSAPFEGCGFPTPVAAEHALVLAARRAHPLS